MRCTGQAVIGNRATLSRAARHIRMVGQPGRPGDVAIGREPCVEPDELLVCGGAIFDVGLNEELAAGLEKAGHLLEQCIAHHEALAMPLLPPRIGKVHEDAPIGRIGREPDQRVRRIFREDAGSRAQTGLGEARVDDGGPLATDLETQKPGARLGLGTLHEKPSAPGTDLDLDPIALNERAHGDMLPLGQARRVFVRARHPNPGALSTGPATSTQGIVRGRIVDGNAHLPAGIECAVGTSRVEARVLVKAPIDRVFERITDHEAMRHWPGIHACTLVTEGNPRNGLGAVRRVKALGVTLDEEVVTYEPPHRYDYSIIKGLPVVHRGVVVLSEVEGGVEVCWRVQLASRFLHVAGVVGAALRFGLPRALRFFASQSFFSGPANRPA